mgnify:CR=1 FL=1
MRLSFSGGVFPFLCPPGESDAEFTDTLSLIDAVGYAQAYSFKYSPRPGTPAALMKPQVAEEIKTERLHHLQQVLDAQLRAFNKSCVGSTFDVLLIGTGAQAAHHVAALTALHPQCAILVRGRDRASEARFCEAHRQMHAAISPCPAAIPDAVQVVITLTNSKEVVYDEAARTDRLVIGVGAFKPDMAEIGARTLGGSAIYADDPAGARHEAGDLLRAKVNWDTVLPLAAALDQPRGDRPVVLKSVGTAAWDLAAARVAMRGLNKPAPGPLNDR